jgi:hypothetical protein
MIERPGKLDIRRKRDKDQGKKQDSGNWREKGEVGQDTIR